MKIKRIEKEIIAQYKNQGDAIIKDIENGVIYLRKERFFKTDAANLLVGGVRGLGAVNRELAIELGFKFLPEIPDMRVIRSMVSFLDDKKDKNKIFREYQIFSIFQNSLIYQNEYSKLPKKSGPLLELSRS